MKLRVLLLGALALATQYASAQITPPTVAVSATITDPNSNACYLGTYTLTLAQPDGSPLYNPTFHGNPIATPSVTGILSSTGAFSVNIVPNTSVDQPSVWLVQIAAPQSPTVLTAASAWVINYRATISGAVDISAQLSAKASPLAYLDLSNGKATFSTGGGSFTAAHDLSGSYTSQTVVGINGVNLAGLGTGILNAEQRSA
jgi:hypothetical protein